MKLPTASTWICPVNVGREKFFGIGGDVKQAFLTVFVDLCIWICFWTYYLYNNRHFLKTINVSEGLWTIQTEKHNLQQDGSSCGVLILMVWILLIYVIGVNVCYFTPTLTLCSLQSSISKVEVSALLKQIQRSQPQESKLQQLFWNTKVSINYPYYMAWLNSNVECGLLFLDNRPLRSITHRYHEKQHIAMDAAGF